MNYNLIALKEEQKVKKELHELFETSIIENVLKEARIETGQDITLNLMKGESFLLSKSLMPSLYSLCLEVKENLQFEENIEFFIINDPLPNAMAIPKNEDNNSNIIVLHSSLIEKFDETELKFIIGHEIGHLISQYRKLKRIIDFVFPEENKIPLVLKNKINYWSRLAELTADRYGFIAAKNLSKVASVFFKMASGLSPGTKIEFKAEAYFDEIDEIINSYQKLGAFLPGTHPVNPIRLKAIQLFSNSQLYQSILNKSALSADSQLEESINTLIVLLKVISDSNLGFHRSVFIVSGGLLMAGIDSALKDVELEAIINGLSNFQIFPTIFIRKMSELPEEKIWNNFIHSIQMILSKNPGERDIMLDYLISIAIVDREIEEVELGFIYKVGTELFGYSKKEIAQHVANIIREKFIPRFY